MEHEYDVHASLVVCRLLLPSYQQREHACESEIVVRLDILVVCVVERRDAVDDVYQLADIGDIEDAVGLDILLRPVSGRVHLSLGERFHEEAERLVEVEALVDDIVDLRLDME